MLATQWDRLLKDLEQRGLARRMAMVELLNEMENSPVFAPVDPATPPPTAEDWLQRRYPESDLANLRGLAFEAVALLRERHPEQMVTVDIGSPDFMPTLLPDNAQVADYHVYADGLTQAIADAAGARLFDVTCVPDPAGNALLRSLLKPDPMPWKEFKRRAARVRASWHAVAWFYANVDNSKYDDWCVAHFEELRPRIAQSVEERFRAGVEFARSRDLPMVMDEGCICYPPLHSRLVELPAGRYSEELAVDIAIATGHWGMLPTGYFRPNTPVWHDASQCAWVRGLNERVLDSRPVRSDPEAPAPS